MQVLRELAAVLAAERDPHVAADRPQRADLRRDRVVADGGHAAPLGRAAAAAASHDERQVELLHPVAWAVVTRLNGG